LLLTYRDVNIDELGRARLSENEKNNLYKSFNSLIILQTCNRIEFYMDGDSDESVITSIIESKIGKEPRLLMDEDAVEHLLRVTSGLDSMFIGEREILSQVKEALSRGKPSRSLRMIFQGAIRFGETFRRRHSMGELSFSRFLSSYIKSALPHLHRVLIIGGGEVARGLIRELMRNAEVTVINRTLDRLAREFGNSVSLKPLTALPWEIYAKRYDVLVAAVSAEEPVLNLAKIPEDYLPSLIIDVSVPRALVPGDRRIILLEDLRLPYIQYINGKSRVLEYIDEVREETRRLMRLLARIDAEEYLRDLMMSVEEARTREVKEALAALRSGKPVEYIIDTMSKSLVKRIMSNYISNMKRSAERGDLELVKLMHDYFMGKYDTS